MEADAEPLDLAEPALPFGFGDAGSEVVPDLHQPISLGRVGAEEGAADAGVFVEAVGAVGAGAGADGQFAALEVAKEVLPLGVSGDAVFLGGTQRTAPGDEGAMGFDG
ncbi:hypothetical protein [Streptomyces alboflavus]|uniref:hypothetical protein n=1 Tax=Streptomyces alboflavus TaxID=67267 RepID=UPI0036B75566